MQRGREEVEAKTWFTAEVQVCTLGMLPRSEEVGAIMKSFLVTVAERGALSPNQSLDGDQVHHLRASGCLAN